MMGEDEGEGETAQSPAGLCGTVIAWACRGELHTARMPTVPGRGRECLRHLQKAQPDTANSMAR